MNQWKNLTKGLLKENPILVLLLGTCPTLGTTSSALNGLSMGLATTFVLIMSNIAISSIKNIVPDKVRIPAYVVVIAAFVSILQMVMQAFVPELYKSLGCSSLLLLLTALFLAGLKLLHLKTISSLRQSTGWEWA